VKNSNKTLNPQRKMVNVLFFCRGCGRIWNGLAFKHPDILMTFLLANIDYFLFMYPGLDVVVVSVPLPRKIRAGAKIMFRFL
jgi:hypothetical protein